MLSGAQYALVQVALRVSVARRTTGHFTPKVSQLRRDRAGDNSNGLFGTGLRAHTYRARFRSCIDGIVQRSAEILILLLICEGDEFTGCIKIYRSRHDARPPFCAAPVFKPMPEWRRFYGGWRNQRRRVAFTDAPAGRPRTQEAVSMVLAILPCGIG